MNMFFPFYLGGPFTPIPIPSAFTVFISVAADPDDDPLAVDAEAGTSQS